MTKPKLTLAQRIFRKVQIDQETGCWVFCGARLPDGYGQIALGRRKVGRVHRVTYEMFNGPIPDGHVIHHTCGTPACCNPAHLVATTQAVHMRDLTADSLAYTNARAETCNRGHPLTPDNLESWSLKRGRRKCSTCARERERTYNQANREKRRESGRLAQRRHRAKKAIISLGLDVTQ